MMTAIDTLKRLFSTSFFPFVFARTFGLQATNALTPLKVRRSLWLYALTLKWSQLCPVQPKNDAMFELVFLSTCLVAVA